MTDLLDVSTTRATATPAIPRRATPPATGPRWVGLLLRGSWAAVTDIAVPLVGVEVLVLIAWAADSRASSGAGAAVRIGACVWLAALHTRVHAGAAVVGIPPLLITLGAILLVARSTRVLVRDRVFQGKRPAATRRELGSVIASVAVPYAVLSAAVAAVVDTPMLHPSPATAAVGGLTVGLLGACWGVVRARKAAGLPLLREAAPPVARTAASAASAALGALGVVSTVMAAALLLAHHKLAGELTGALSPGLVGTVVFTILQVALAPVLVVGAASWLSGPGFAVGTGTSVTPWGTALGPVPAVPLLAALPQGSSHLGSVALVVPLACGVLAGSVVLRRTRPGSWWLPFAVVAGAAALAGVAACVLAYAAGGPAGPGRLLTVGPSGWRVGLALTAEVALGGLLACAAQLAWRTRATTFAAAASARGDLSRRVRRQRARP